MSVSIATAQELDNNAKKEVNITPDSEKKESEIIENIQQNTKKEDSIPKEPKDVDIKSEDLSNQVREKIEKKYWREQNEKRKDPEKVEVIVPYQIVKDEGWNVTKILIIVGLTILSFLGFKLFKKSLENKQNQDDKGTDSFSNIPSDSDKTVWAHLQGKAYDNQ